MTDSIACFPPGWRALDANGVTIPGAKLKFFNSGTSTPKTVYSDEALTVSLGTVVTCDAGGYPTSDGSAKVVIYTGTALYKLTITTSDDETVASHDAIKGAPAIPATSDSALPETPVVTKTTTYSVVAADQGKVINANPTGGSFAITLLEAATAGDGYRLTIRHVGLSSSNAVTVRTASEAISYAGKSVTSFALTGYGHSVALVSDGAAWHVDGFAPPMMIDGVSFVRITDRLTAPPTAPTAGARYIVNGTATGVWSTLSFVQHDIVEADGNGSWIKYTPTSGTLAWIIDETLYSAFNGTTWADQTGMGAPSATTLQSAVFEHQLANGTAGGTGTGAAWTARTLNTSVKNTITGCSLSSNQVTLPVGTYVLSGWQSLVQTVGTQTRVKVISGTATPDPILNGVAQNYAADSGGHTPGTIAGGWPFCGVLTVTATAVIELQYWYSSTSGGAGSLGTPSGEPAGSPEVYAHLTILSLAAQQGPTGPQGVQGTDGLDAAYPYQWSTATSGDPGSGKVRGNDATIASITELAFSETDSAGGGMAAVIALWDDSTSTAKARVKISKEGSTQNFHAFTVTGTATDQGAYWTIPVSYVSTSGTIANSDNCAVVVIEKGDKGDTGATGAAAPLSLDYTWSTATSGDPGTGSMRIDHATPASLTGIAISETDRLGNVRATTIAQFDDSTSARKGRLDIIDAANPANYVVVYLTGAMTDVGSYRTMAASYVEHGGTLSAAARLSVIFQQTGDAGTGDVNGPASSIDNELPVFNGTTGKIIEKSGVVVYTPELYGCVGDGTNDDSANLQTMFTAAAAAAATGKNVLVWLSNVYAASVSIGVFGWSPGKLTIQSRNGGGLKAIGSATFSLLAVGSGGLTGVSQAITANAALGATVITVASGAAFAVGDYVVIANNTGNASAPADNRQMLNRVKSKSGNDLTLYRALTFAVNTANTATCAVASISSGLEISGLTLYGSAATGNSSGLQVQCCIDAVVANIRSIGFRSVGQSYVLLDRGSFNSLSDDGSCSAISNAAIAFDRVTGADMAGIRSRDSGSFGISFDFLADCAVHGVDVSNATGRALKLAGTCGNALDGLSVTGCASTGISITSGSANNTGTNWTALGCGGEGVWFNGAGNTGNIVSNVIAFGNAGSDISTSTTGGLDDSGTTIIGHNPAATIVLNSPSTRAIASDDFYYAGGTDVAIADGGTGASTAYGAYDNLHLRGADIASASTINLDAATGHIVDVTGTTTITAITLADGKSRWVRFTGALTLTNGASLVLPTGANITTAAGDVAVFKGYASGVVRCVHYQRISGEALAGSANFTAVPDGSESAPAFAFASDTNTGFYRVGSDQLGVVAGGKRVARFGTSGADAFIVGQNVTGGSYGMQIIGGTNVGGPQIRYSYADAGTDQKNFTMQTDIGGGFAFSTTTDGGANTTRLYLARSGYAGVGIEDSTPIRKMHVREEASGTSAVQYVERLEYRSTGTPAAGIGVGTEYMVETSAGNYEIGATIEAVTTDVTATSEDFDIVFRAMAAGAGASEVFRLKSTGQLRVVSGATAANGSVATVLGSLGPAGSNTTVQGWLAIDVAGTTRYLPFW